MPVKKNDTAGLTFVRPQMESGHSLPYVDHGVSAGFPSPAMDFMESRIDLNKILCENPLSTFYIRVDGHSMTDAGIDDRDVLVVDRSLEPRDKSIAICFIDGAFTVKRIKVEKDALWLMPENAKYSAIKVEEENQFMVWGIVTYVIKKL